MSFARWYGSALPKRTQLPAVYPPIIPRYEEAVAKYQDLIGPEDGLMATTGTAWVVGDHVRSEEILAMELLQGEPARLRPHLFAARGTAFLQHLKPGDFLVAGHDFAADATHRTIALALKQAGIAAVIARSFGRFFYRHALHAGLPALIVEETAAIKNGDLLRVDIEAHTVANRNSGDRYVIRNSDDETIEILRAGGVHGTVHRQSE